MTGLGANTDVLIDGLKRLEYRGYDSAGIATVGPHGLFRLRGAVGTNTISFLSKQLSIAPDSASFQAGIGHTRWATHGRPTEDNAHPHLDCAGTIAVVHNGIVENYRLIRQRLSVQGHIFTSDTDTEVIAHLIESHILDGLSFAKAVQISFEEMDGAMAFLAISLSEPTKIYGVRRLAPLIVGVRGPTAYFASDLPAIMDKADEYFHVPEGVVVELEGGRAVELKTDGGEVGLSEMKVAWSLDVAERGGFEDFMSKEISEQPAAIRDTLAGRIGPSGEMVLDEIRIDPDELRRINKVFIIACGTSYHSAMVAKYAIEHFCRLPVEIDVSSEFRYRDPVVDSSTLVIAVAQSGETLDTMSALKEAIGAGAKTLVVTNVVGSSMARMSDAVLYTHAGPEIGVAATKTHIAQMVALEVVALYLAQLRNTLFPSEIAELSEQLSELAEKVSMVIERAAQYKEISEQLTPYKRFYFIGRHVGFPVALEGALKLKEISYLGAEGYPAGELKHGPIAMIDESTVVIALASRTRLWEKMVGNIEEVKARGAKLIVVANDGDDETASLAEAAFFVPRTHPLFAPIVDVVPLQFLAYNLAKSMGNDVDRPRNLAKTVTVE